MPRHAGYFIVHREHRDLILEQYGQSAPSVLCVWTALMDLCNREHSHIVSVRQSVIARLAGVSVRTTQAALQNLEGLGLVTSRSLTIPSGGRGINEYTVVPLEEKLLRVNATKTNHDDEATPVKNLRNISIGKRYKKEAASTVDAAGRTKLSVSERITLEKESQTLEQSVATLRSDLRYFQGTEREAHLAQIRKEDARLSFIRTQLGGGA